MDPSIPVPRCVNNPEEISVRLRGPPRALLPFLPDGILRGEVGTPMRRLIVAGFLLVVAGFALYGQSTTPKPFVVQYLDGSVQVQLKGQTAWNTLKDKAVVPADASIRLGVGAMIELANGKTVISLIKQGVYPMAGLVSKLPADGSGLGAAVAQKLAALTSSGIAGSSQVNAVGGVRAGCYDETIWHDGGYSRKQKLLDEGYKAEQLAAKNISKEGFPIDNLQFYYWGIKGGYADIETPRMYEEYKDAIDLGIRALIDANHTEAIEHLRSAVTASIFPDEILRANYLLAAALVEAGSPARAWKIISGLNVKEGDFEYGDILVRKAQLQVDAFQYEDSLATLKPLLEPLAKDEFGQVACLVAYYAYKGLNRNKEASEMKKKGLGIVIDCPLDNRVKVETPAAKILISLD
jgi:hypothetical protein